VGGGEEKGVRGGDGERYGGGLGGGGGGRMRGEGEGMAGQVRDR